MNIVETLMAMLDSENRFARYGAAEALGRVGFASREAADKLIRMMAEDADTQFRVHAVNALNSSDRRLGLIAVAEPAIPVLLRMATETLDDDPRGVLQHDIIERINAAGEMPDLTSIEARLNPADIPPRDGP